MCCLWWWIFLEGCCNCCVSLDLYFGRKEFWKNVYRL